jgi:hypothetical protein
MQSVLTNIRSISRVAIIRVNVIVTVVPSIVRHQIRIEFHVVHVINVEAIQITLVLAVVSTRIVVYNLVAVNFPTCVVIDLSTIEVIARPVVLNHVVLKQVPSTIGIVDIIQVKSVSIRTTGFTHITVLHRITGNVVIRSIVNIERICAISTAIGLQIVYCIPCQINHIVVVHVEIIRIVVNHDILLNVLVNHKRIGSVTIVIVSIYAIPISDIIGCRTTTRTTVRQIMHIGTTDHR